jgi:hypothetical protein
VHGSRAVIVPRDVEGEAFAQGAEAACEETRENWVFEQSITWIRQIWLFCGDSSKSGFFVRSRQELVISRGNWSRTAKIVARGFTCATIRDRWSIWESSSGFVDASDFRRQVVQGSSGFVDVSEFGARPLQ